MAGIPESILCPSSLAQPSGSSSFRFFGSNALDKASYMGFTDLAVKGGSYTPLPGDIIFYASSAYTGNPSGVSYKHVGIVESCTYTYNSDGAVSSMVLTTIEGNTSDKVSNKKWTVKPDGSGYVYSGCYIAGFGIPDYHTSIRPESTSYDLGVYGGSILRNGSTGNNVFKLQLALNVLSVKYSLTTPDVNGVFDSKTEKAVREYQQALSLEADGLVGSATWGSLRSQLNALTGSVKGDFIVRDKKLVLYMGNEPTVRLPDEVTAVCSGAFMNCDSVQTLRFSPNLSTIEANAFLNCTSLQKTIYMCTEQNFSRLNINYTGNDALKNASVEYGTCVITFVDGVGERTEVECSLGEMPKIPELPKTFDDGEYIHYFLGWDSEIVAAADDCIYTALYIQVPSSPVHFNIEGKIGYGGQSVSVPLRFSGNNCGIFKASLSIDYSENAQQLIYTGFTADLAGVEATVQESAQGVLQIELFNVFEESGQALTLHFKIADDVRAGSIPLRILDSSSVFCSDDGVNLYALNGVYTSGEISIQSYALYDVDEDGILSIADVTLMLNTLSKGQNQTHGSVPNSSEFNFDISDVTELLNVLAKSENGQGA